MSARWSFCFGFQPSPLLERVLFLGQLVDRDQVHTADGTAAGAGLLDLGVHGAGPLPRTTRRPRGSGPAPCTPRSSRPAPAAVPSAVWTWSRSTSCPRNRTRSSNGLGWKPKQNDHLADIYSHDLVGAQGEVIRALAAMRLAREK